MHIYGEKSLRYAKSNNQRFAAYSEWHEEVLEQEKYS